LGREKQLYMCAKSLLGVIITLPWFPSV
jgi:hypothetical protein